MKMVYLRVMKNMVVLEGCERPFNFNDGSHTLLCVFEGLEENDMFLF